MSDTKSQEIALVHALARMDDDTFAYEWERIAPSDRRAMSAAALRIKRQLEDPTPGHLAMRLDPMTVQTPALDIIDAHLVQIRDAVETMYLRRAKLAELVNSGMDEKEATELSAEIVPAKGIDRLIVSMPPQEGKSQRISVVGMLWLLRQFPMLRIGLVSYDQDNATTFSHAIRNFIELYDGTGGNIDLGLRLMKDQKAMSRFTLVTGGSVYAIGVMGGLTGKPLDLLLIDDPVKDIRAADSVLISQQTWEWWQTVARPRLAPWAPAIDVQTRWAELDPAGRLITKQKEDESAGVAHFDKWTVINISAQADHDPNKGETDILGREPGEFMMSARGRTTAQWEATKAATAERFWNALFQGKPSPTMGSVLLTHWWRRYSEALWTQQSDGTFRIAGYELFQSWDFAFRDLSSSDYVVGGVWAKKGADSYLVTVLRARLTFTASLDAMRRISRLFPQSKRKYVEAKANGDAIIDSLRHEIAGIIDVTPDQSKTTRAIAASPFVRSGNFYIPTTTVAAMNPEISFDPEAFIDEATAFPFGTHDDQVDMWSQYAKMLYIENSTGQIISPVGAGQRRPARAKQASEMAQRLAAREAS